MLENIVGNKSKKVSDLESVLINQASVKSFDLCERVCVSKTNSTQRDSENLQSSSNCGVCEYVSDSESDIRKHMLSKHKLSCDICDLTFKSLMKLQTHMCQIQVKNPTCCNYYSRN